VTINSITFVAHTAATDPTNQIFGLYDSSRNLLRSTVNDTTTAWGGVAAKTLALTSSFVTTYEGLHYLAIVVTATTAVALIGIPSSSSTTTTGLAPMLAGTSNTGLTTTLPNPANAMTVQGAPYAYVS
jgi:hypothetical protein